MADPEIYLKRVSKQENKRQFKYNNISGSRDIFFFYILQISNSFDTLATQTQFSKIFVSPSTKRIGEREHSKNINITSEFELNIYCLSSILINFFQHKIFLKKHENAPFKIKFLNKKGSFIFIPYFNHKKTQVQSEEMLGNKSKFIYLRY